jgi:outer membrane protein OmpA-like peptidoglycan-associated protein
MATPEGVAKADAKADGVTQEEEVIGTTHSILSVKESEDFALKSAGGSVSAPTDPSFPAGSEPHFNASTWHMLVFGALWLHFKPEHRKLANAVLLKKWLTGVFFGGLGSLPVAQACLLLAVEAAYLAVLVVKRPYHLRSVYAAEVAFSVGTALTYLAPLVLALTPAPPVVLTAFMFAQLLLCLGFVLANVPHALGLLRDSLPKCREKWYDDYKPAHVGMRTGGVYREADGTVRVVRVLGLDDAWAREAAESQGAVFVHGLAPVHKRWKHHFQLRNVLLTGQVYHVDGTEPLDPFDERETDEEAQLASRRATRHKRLAKSMSKDFTTNSAFLELADAHTNSGAGGLRRTWQKAAASVKLRRKAELAEEPRLSGSTNTRTPSRSGTASQRGHRNRHEKAWVSLALRSEPHRRHLHAPYLHPQGSGTFNKSGGEEGAYTCYTSHSLPFSVYCFLNFTYTLIAAVVQSPTKLTLLRRLAKSVVHTSGEATPAMATLVQTVIKQQSEVDFNPPDFVLPRRISDAVEVIPTTDVQGIEQEEPTEAAESLVINIDTAVATAGIDDEAGSLIIPTLSSENTCSSEPAVDVPEAAQQQQENEEGARRIEERRLKKERKARRRQRKIVLQDEEAAAALAEASVVPKQEEPLFEIEEVVSVPAPPPEEAPEEEREALFEIGEEKVVVAAPEVDEEQIMDVDGLLEEGEKEVEAARKWRTGKDEIVDLLAEPTTEVLVEGAVPEVPEAEVSSSTVMADEETEFYVIVDGKIMLKKAVRFNKDSAVLLSAVNEPLLYALARLFMRYPNTTVLLVGFTQGRLSQGKDVDSKQRPLFTDKGKRTTGTFMQLSQWRAEVCGRELTRRGINFQRLMTLGLGTDGMGKRTEVYVGNRAKMQQFRREIEMEHRGTKKRGGWAQANKVLAAVRMKANLTDVYNTQQGGGDDEDVDES